MLLSVVISGSEVCKDSFRLCAHTSLVPRASKGLWMTLGKCKKFQSRRTGRVNILSKMIFFFFWCFLIQLPALQFFFFVNLHVSFFSPVPKQYLTQHSCSGVESLALLGITERSAGK